jgi:hypothetical protein
LSSQTNTSVTVAKTGASNSQGVLTATFNGVSVSKTITPCNISITGDIACAIGTGTFSITGLPAGISANQITWTCSSNLQITDNNNIGTTKSFQVISLAYYNYSWVRASIGSQVIAEKAVNVYIIGAAYISGASTLTPNSTQTYTLNDFMDPRLLNGDNTALPCYAVSWTCSLNLSYLMVKTSKSVSVTANIIGSGWLRAHITVNGITQTVLKDILVSNSTPVMSVSLNTYSIVGGNDIYATAVTSPTATGYIWTYNGQILTTTCPDVVLIYNPALPSQTIPLMVSASNGTISGSASQTVSGKFVLSEFCTNVLVGSYPNPVSDILRVEITSPTQNTAVVSALLNNRTYDIRLYSMQGSLVRQATGKAGTTSIDVSGLPDGIYLLNVFDGINEAIVRQIIVSH